VTDELERRGEDMADGRTERDGDSAQVDQPDRERGQAAASTADQAKERERETEESGEENAG
jgi:hypothetical protein